MDATSIWFLVLLALAFVAILLIRPAPPKPDPEEEGAAPANIPDRLEILCKQLTGEPTADARIINQVLTFGPQVLPLLVEQLVERLRASDPPPPAIQAALEGLISDFGLAGVPTICERLGRLRATTRSAPALLRLIDRLGASGARGCLGRALHKPTLQVFTPHLRRPGPRRTDPPGIALQCLAEIKAPQRALALDLLAGWCADHPDLLVHLMGQWDVAGRALLLRWLHSWRPLITEGLIARGLSDRAAAVRAEAASLSLVFDPPAVMEGVCAALSDADESVRLQATRALLLYGGPLDEGPLVEAMADADPEVALGATLALWRHGRRADARPPALATDPRWGLVAPKGPTQAEVGHLTGLLDAEASPHRRTAIWALALAAPGDPRAQERLLLLAGDRTDPLRVEALAAAVVAGAEPPPDLLVQALDGATTPTPLLIWCRRACAEASPTLARAVAREGDPRGLLALLRAGPLAPAVSSLLRALERCRTPEHELALATTLYLGGEAVESAIHDALEQSGRGLLTAALQYSSIYLAPATLPLLAQVHHQHPPLQSVALNLLESMGEEAAPILREAIAHGGEPDAVVELERRLDVLLCCTGHGRVA